jgi:hypothetical protein
MSLLVLYQLLLMVLWFSLLVLSVLFKETGITLCGVVVASAAIVIISSIWRARSGEVTVAVKNEDEVNQAAHSGFILRLLCLHFPWIVLCFLSLLVYLVFRAALIDPRGFWPAFSILFSADAIRWKDFIANIGRAYLGDSQLIRKAENPFSLLVGTEKVLSLMVSASYVISHHLSLSL